MTPSSNTTSSKPKSNTTSDIGYYRRQNSPTSASNWTISSASTSNNIPRQPP